MRRSLFGYSLLVSAVALLVTGACGGGSEKKSCEPGAETCPCYGNKTCNDGLECLSNLCVNTGNAAGGSPGNGGAGASSGKTSLGGGSEQGGDQDVGYGSGGKASGGASAQGGKNGATGGTNGAGTTGNPAGTPVELHGALAVSGADLIDASGARVKLEGMSSMWLNWDPTGYAVSKEGLEWMRDNWNLRVFRAAMGVDAEDAYLVNSAGMKEKVNQIVQNAIDLGIYVIIDWHDHEALTHQAEAQAFFDEMSKKWGSYPNVIYEVFNEPLKLDWSTQLKPYHQALVSTIRANDPDNVIVLGTPNWDQDVDAAAVSPLSGKNLMYALHFYSCTHNSIQRDRAKTARSRGLPMFVTEWGATDADGGTDGVVCQAEAQAWHDWLDANNISWCAWKLDGCTDSTCMFKDRTVPVSGGWSQQQLNGHAPFVIKQMTNDPASGGKGGGGSGGGGNTGGGNAGTGGSGGTTTNDFPPDPAGCKFVSCTSCCETTGVFALNETYDDITSQAVRSFTVNSTSISASFSFTGRGQAGAIFFKFGSDQNISQLGLSASASGGALQLALVHGSTEGCTYDVIGGDVYFNSCWGSIEWPEELELVDQIEVRVFSTAANTASLIVEGLEI